MIESTLFTTLSTNEEANLSGGGGKPHGGKSGGGNETNPKFNGFNKNSGNISVQIGDHAASGQNIDNSKGYW